MNQIYRKLAFFIIIQIVYYNSLYLLFISEIYSNYFYLIALISYYIFSFVDTIIRPLQDEERDPKSERFTIILIILFLINPLFLITSVIERKALVEVYLPIWNQNVISIIGLFFFILSSCIMILGRIQLGKFATGKLSIQDDHKLINSGLYKYIRHPIYAGSIIGSFFFLMVFNSILTAVIYMLVMFLILNQRADYEERILLQKFGNDYSKYCQKTNRYFPFLY